MTGWELLIPLAAWAGDVLRRRTKAGREFERVAAKTVFAQAVKIFGSDKVAVRQGFRRLFDAAWAAAGERPSIVVEQRADALFEELWEIYARAEWDAAMVALAKAGNRAERFADALLKQAEVRESRPAGRPLSDASHLRAEAKATNSVKSPPPTKPGR